MTVQSLPPISFIKHYINISLSRVAMNKPTGYGMRRQVSRRTERPDAVVTDTPGQEEDWVLCCEVSCMLAFVSTSENLIDLVCSVKGNL